MAGIVDHAPDGARNDLSGVWVNGYSIAELWGYTKPVSRPEPASGQTHVLLWGILSIVDYQVDQGAGHSYLRDRLWNRDWIAIGFLEPKTADSSLQIVPPIPIPVPQPLAQVTMAGALVDLIFDDAQNSPQQDVSLD